MRILCETENVRVSIKSALSHWILNNQDQIRKPWFYFVLSIHLSLGQAILKNIDAGRQYAINGGVLLQLVESEKDPIPVATWEMITKSNRATRQATKRIEHQLRTLTSTILFVSLTRNGSERHRRRWIVQLHP